MKTLLILLFTIGLYQMSSASEDSQPSGSISSSSVEGHTNSKTRTEDYRLDAFRSAIVSNTKVPQVVSLQVPTATTTVSHEELEGAVNEAIKEIMGGHVVAVKMPDVFLRPKGPLPVLPDRFGFEEHLIGPDAMPNCGCLTIGSCVGKVGAYTKLVMPYSDLQCAYPFDACCFDGKWPGVYDSFAAAAACVDQKQCLRPYGVLPTDVRDFGAIAPCPGRGVVRCMMVDDAALLEFKAAVAAIGAANAHNALFAYKPAHFVVPIVEGGVASAGADSSSSAFAQGLSTSSHIVEEGDTKEAPAPATVIQPSPNIIVNPPPAAQPNIYVNPPPAAQPNIYLNPPPAVQPNIYVNISPPTPSHVIEKETPPTVITPSLPPNIIVNPPPPATQPIYVNGPLAPLPPQYFVGHPFLYKKALKKAIFDKIVGKKLMFKKLMIEKKRKMLHF